MKQNEKKRYISVIGAREHNLKNVSVDIPKDALTVITGPSGSGKSSLALDILYAEGQRRYMESLSSYARQFLGMPKKPDFDRIDGLCPAIAIEQKTVGSNPRSTVGTITEISDYLRVLYARIGVTHCATCYQPVNACSTEQITGLIIENHRDHFITLASPLVREKKGEFINELLDLFKAGHYRFTIDGIPYKFQSPDEIRALKLGKTYHHSIDLLVDAFDVADTPDCRARILEATEKACALANGACKVVAGSTERLYSTQRMCLECGTAVPELEPRIFSFNSPLGACKGCHGLGLLTTDYYWRAYTDEVDEALANGASAHIMVCSHCSGKRLNPQALAVTIAQTTIHDIGEYSIEQALNFFTTLQLSAREHEIASRLIEETTSRLRFLCDVGLSYLSLNRTARTLSGGEGQRIRLARQLGSALSGVLYILDEPSIGLHQRDNDQLIATLKRLRDLGNTVVVVEHDHDTMQNADHLIDMGPAAGIHGGTVIAAGTPAELQNNERSLSGAYLAGRRTISRSRSLRVPTKFLTLSNARANNLKNCTVTFPLNVLCGISGVSGSGKSSLIMDELVPAVQSRLSQSQPTATSKKLGGAEQLKNMVVIDQSPIGRTPRSNAATYLGIFNDIRALFAGLPESKARGYDVGRFSFNVKGGRCETCSGEGSITVAMHFLPDVAMTCKDCKGLRYSQQTLAIQYKNKTIAQVLDMTALEAVAFFSAHAPLSKRLQLLCDVGLDYVKLGQPATTFSGGEAQRIKLVNELAKRGEGTLYILDEPTTGLHASDIEKLLQVFNRLIDKGNSMVVIEHNLDVLKTADYLIDLGPEGGDNGGTIVAYGTPDAIAACEKSHTGKYLKRVLEN